MAVTISYEKTTSSIEYSITRLEETVFSNNNQIAHFKEIAKSISFEETVLSNKTQVARIVEI